MRLANVMRTDVTLQARNQLYAISVAVSVVCGGALAWLSPPDRVGGTVPMALLMFVGGSTLLYVVAMVILERDDGVLDAISVSPVRPWEYLASKVVTLTGLATLEGVLICAGALAILGRNAEVGWPNPLLLVGLLAAGAMHVLIGLIIVARYRRLMDALIPMSAVATVLQLPAFWFVGALDHPALLAIPSAGPTMLIRGAFVPLSAGQWAYAIGMTVVPLAILARWCQRSFIVHIRNAAGAA